VWQSDLPRIAELLTAEGWTHAPEQDEDRYTGHERGGVRLELAFLARGEDGNPYTPSQEGPVAWPDGAFADDVAELRGVRAHVIGLRALEADKAAARDDPVVAAKDRADPEHP